MFPRALAWAALLLGLANAALAQPASDFTALPLVHTYTSGEPHGTGYEDGYRVLATDGVRLAVGIPDNSYETGYGGIVYIYRREAGQWIEEQVITPTADYPGAGFGLAVALHGDLLAVMVERSFVGFGNAIYLFRRSAGHWQFEQRFAFDAPNYKYLVPNMALGADWLVTDVANEDTVYAFRRVGGAWQPPEGLRPAALASGSGFGTTLVALDDGFLGGAENVTVGALARAGRVYRYRLVDGVWTEAPTLDPPQPVSNGAFGRDIVRLGDRVVISAYGGGSSIPSPRVHRYRVAGAELTLDGSSIDVPQVSARAFAANDDTLFHGALFSDAGGHEDTGIVHVQRIAPDGSVAGTGELLAPGTFNREEAGLGAAAVAGPDWLVAVAEGMFGGDGLMFSYRRDGSDWIAEGPMGPLPNGENSLYGQSIAHDGQWLGITHRLARDPATLDYSGSVHLYESTPSGRVLRQRIFGVQGPLDFDQGRLLAGTRILERDVTNTWSAVADLDVPGVGLFAYHRAGVLAGDLVFLSDPDAILDPTVSSNELVGGRVDVFARGSQGWAHLQTLWNPVAASLSVNRFGATLAYIDGILFVGAPSQGVVRLYARAPDGRFEPYGSMTPPSGPGSSFGLGMAEHGGVLAVSGGGPIYVYDVRDATQPALLQAVNARVGDNTEQFGIALHWFGNNLAVTKGFSDYTADEYARIHVYAPVAGQWTYSQTLLSPRAERDGFGAAASYANGELVIGAPLAGDLVSNTPDAGVAYAYSAQLFRDGFDD